MEEELTQEKLKEREIIKIEGRYRRVFNKSLLYFCSMAIIGTGILIKDNFDSRKFEQKYRTSLVETYLKIGPTLEKLRSEVKNIKTKVELPYQTKEIKNNLEVIYGAELKRASLLEETIAKVEADSVRLSQHEKIKDYNKVKKRERKREGKKILMPIGLICFGFIPSLIITNFAGRRYKKELAKLEKKYPSKARGAE